MEKYRKILTPLLILIPFALVFKNFFEITNPLVWGDAPYFYPENLQELFNLPFAWDIRTSNFGSSQLLTLWLYIPTFLLGILYFLFHLNYEVSIRIIFYFSYLYSSSIGVYLLLRRFNFNDLAIAFGVVFFTINTYSILLIDGGQIGVLLSYGLFPLVFLSILNFLDKKSLGSFLLASFAHFLIFNTDLRIALILIIFELCWFLFILEKKFRELSKLLLTYAIVLTLSSFWVIPFFTGLAGKLDNSIVNNEPNFIHIINSFYLYQPHFPNNDFGALNTTPIYFIFLPVILFLGVLSGKKQTVSLGLMFIFFVFLSKGSNAPFGEVYNFITNNFPLGSSFRDSSKFYIPALLVASFMLGFSVEFIREKFNKLKFIWLVFIYAFLLLSIYPVFNGGLSGVLGKSPNRNDFQRIYELIKSSNSSYRTLWFNERPSLGFADWEHPAVSANLLFKERPFASMIDGDYDLFGFLHNENISQWYKLLGIKYIFYPPNERDKNLTKKEEKERQQFKKFVSTLPNLKRKDLDISFPVYETQNSLPKIFGQEKIIFALGGDDLYEKLFEFKNYNLGNAGVVFLESCRFDPEILFNLDEKSFDLILKKDRNDLYLSFFCNNLLSPTISKTKEWSLNNSSKYLNWKAQLLERGIRNYDYDFNKGMAYSTRRGEKLQFEINIAQNQNYYVAIRYFTGQQSNGLKVDFPPVKKILKSKNPEKLEWELIGPLNLNKGVHLITLTNLGGVEVFNTLGFIPQAIFDQKRNQINNKLDVVNAFNIEEIQPLNSFVKNKIIPLEFEMVNPTEYKVITKSLAKWLVFSERSDNDWQLEDGLTIKKPLPFYSMINGFYIGDLNENSKVRVYYKHQISVKNGLLISLISLLLVGIIIIFPIINSSGYIQKGFKNPKN